MPPAATPATARSLEEAWRRFKSHNDQKARAAIIDNYSYLVKITAGRVVANLPPNLEREDLYTAGAMGLIKAVDQFDFSRKVKFETYAIALIRGAILESLREEDWVPRSVRERAKTLERTFSLLEVQNGVPATEQQVCLLYPSDAADRLPCVDPRGRRMLQKKTN